MTEPEQAEKVIKAIHNAALEFILDNPSFLYHLAEIEAAMLIGAITAGSVLKNEQEAA